MSQKQPLWMFCKKGVLKNFAKFLRTPFFTEHLQWLLLTCLACSKSTHFMPIFTFSWKPFSILRQLPQSSHRRCSMKKLLSKLLQYSQENTCVRVCNFIKKRLQHRCYCEFFKNTCLRTSTNGCFWEYWTTMKRRRTLIQNVLAL